MTGARRTAILALVAAGSGACEALVGITDRQVGSHPDLDSGGSGSDATGGSDLGSGGDMGTTPPSDTGAEAWIGMDGGDSGVLGPDGDAAIGPTNDANEAGDGAPARDASDGGDGAVADPDQPCSKQGAVVFCDDFDTSAAVSDGWDFTNILGDSGSYQLDTVTWVSMPKAAQIVVSPVPGGVGGVQLGKTLSPFPAGVRLALDVRIANASYANFPQLAVAQLYIHQGTSAQTQVNFIIGPGSTSVLQAFPPDAGAALTLSPAAPAPMTWMRVVLSYAADGSLTLLENGQVLGSVNIPPGAANTVGVLTGAAFVNPSGTATVTFDIDNVVVKAQ